MEFKKYIRFIWAFVFIAIGILFLLENLNIGNIVVKELFKTYWPVILIFLGLYVIIFSSAGHLRVHKEMKDVNLSEENMLYIRKSFGSFNYNMKDKMIKGGKINFSFGDALVDLGGSKLSAGNNKIYINTSFSSFKMLIPDRFAVKLHGTVTFGEIKFNEKKDDGLSAYMEYETAGYETAKSKLEIFLTGSLTEVVFKTVK